MRITVLGATGHTGALLMSALRRRNVDVLACGRDERALARLAKDHAVATQRVDVTDAPSVRAALREADAVANLAGPFQATGFAAIAEAVDAGIAYADTTGEQAFILDARARYHAAARAAGVPVVNALAYEYALSDLAIHREFAEGATAFHVFYRARQAQASAGTKKSILRVMAGRGYGFERGRLVPTTSAKHARTFQTVDGPRRAVTFPGGDVVNLPRHVSCSTVRTYVPVKPGREGVARVAGVAARALLHGPLLDAAERVVDATHKPPANERAQGEIYVEAEEGGLAPLLIRTPDPYVVTAELIAEGVTRLAREPRAGVLAPAEALDASSLLESLSALPGFGVSRAHPAVDETRK